MKVLYANPVFADYRLAFYKRLSELFEGSFFVMYSPNRYQNKLSNGAGALAKIPVVLKDVAYPYEKEKTFIVKRPFANEFDSQLKIPLLKDFFKHLAKERPDVFITEGFFQWTPYIVLYAWLHGKPVYLSYERTLHTERFCPQYLTLYRKFINRFIKGYLVNGTESRRYLESIGVKAEKIHVAGMNADSAALQAGIASMSKADIEKLKTEMSISEGGITYLYSGQFIERKGIGYMLESWMEHIKQHPKDHLILLGTGPMFAGFKEKYGTVSSIHLMGKIAFDETYKYYAIADVFIIPTLEDNWCLVVPEAMSCGLPVACSKYNGGATDLIREEENGTVFDPLNKESMLYAFGFFHGKDLEAMGKRSIELEMPFNTNNCAQRFFDVINRENHID